MPAQVARVWNTSQTVAPGGLRVAQRSKTKLILSILALVTAVVLVYQWWTGAPVTAPVSEVDSSGGAYAALSTDQRRLVDDWVDRYSKATGRQANAGALYDELALSTRTTFNAVTHALSRTRLTDASEQPMNLTALDLILKVDAVAGRVADAGGDKQFRMYVQLRPDARQLLERSREFSRQVDNTVFHKGYPICFRGASGTPSIQFSLSPDGLRGDIDVDYRPSAFPIMLINGHLTASNSDVRAGNNDARHNGHWAGLTNWWRSFMGLVVGEFATDTAAASAKAVANAPRLGSNARPEQAIADFLQAWLVERNPGAAAGYISPRAFACIEVEKGTPVDRGVARYQMVSAMQAVNDRLGKFDKLVEAIRGVSLTGPRGKEMPQPNRDAFVMYDVREDLAEQFDCENRLHPDQADAKKAQSAEFGKYVGAVFQVKTARVTGDSVATLWTKEKDVWQLVAYDVEPEFKPGMLPAAPATPPATAEPVLPVIDGNPDMLRAAGDFFDAWFMRKDAAAAFRHLSPASYSCYNVFRAADAAPATTRAQGGTLIVERMGALANWTGPATRLPELITGVEAHHPDLKLVKHASSDAFTVVAIPDSMAIAAECHRLKPGVAPHFEREGEKTYGNFYAAAIRVKRAGPDGSVLWTVWGRSGPIWKVVSYLIVTP
jgi:hypothetical protein